MESAIFLAKFWGWFLVTVSIVYLLQRKVLLSEISKLMNDRGFSILSGYIAFTIGLVSVLLHNIWIFDWRIIITIFGWLSLIKGIIRIGFPKMVGHSAAYFNNKILVTNLILLAMLSLGVRLLFV